MKENTEEKQLITSNNANIFKKVLTFFKSLFTKKHITIYDGAPIPEKSSTKFSFKNDLQLNQLIGDIEILALQERLSKKEVVAEDLTLEELDKIINLYNEQLQDLDTLFRKKKNELTILSYRLKSQKENLKNKMKQ